MKKEVFIEKARSVHGDKYDYSLVPYEFLTKNKVEIVCEKHGSFFQTSGNHVCNKRGCPACGFDHVSTLKKKKSADSFIEDAIAVHGDLYDYSEFIYVKSATPSTIICKTHGSFLQRPNAHLRGQGCPKCWANSSSLKQRKDTQWFIDRAREVHGDRYDYSFVDYVKNNVKVVIVCKKHGKFEQQPNNHMNGNNCPECVKEYMSEKFRLPYNEFLSKVKEVHGDNYALVDVSYRNLDEKIELTCKTHGNFKILARHFINGIGCPKCGILRNTIRRSKNQDYYIPLFLEVHGDTYCYSKTSFDKSKEKFLVTCIEHGDFESSVWNHLKGQGCPKCSVRNSANRDNPCSLYIMSVGKDFIKVGISNSVDRRLSELKDGSVYEINKIIQYDFLIGHDAVILEKILLGEYDFGVIEKSSLSSGYTEVTYRENYENIISLIEDYIADSSFTNTA